jgi:hypothetical protein
MVHQAVYALIVTFFFHPVGDTVPFARANVHVIDHGLTAEDCIERMEEINPEEFGDHTVISCSYDYDF